MILNHFLSLFGLTLVLFWITFLVMIVAISDVQVVFFDVKIVEIGNDLLNLVTDLKLGIFHYIHQCFITFSISISLSISSLLDHQSNGINLCSSDLLDLPNEKEV